MGAGCKYFQSEEWRERLEEIKNRIFDIETVIWGCDEINNTEPVVQRIVENTELDKEQLCRMKPEAALSKIPDDILG